MDKDTEYKKAKKIVEKYEKEQNQYKNAIDVLEKAAAIVKDFEKMKNSSVNVYDDNGEHVAQFQLGDWHFQIMAEIGGNDLAIFFGHKREVDFDEGNEETPNCVVAYLNSPNRNVIIKTKDQHPEVIGNTIKALKYD